MTQDEFNDQWQQLYDEHVDGCDICDPGIKLCTTATSLLLEWREKWIELFGENDGN